MTAESEAYLIRREKRRGETNSDGPRNCDNWTGSGVVLRADESAWQGPREKYAVFAWAETEMRPVRVFRVGCVRHARSTPWFTLLASGQHCCASLYTQGGSSASRLCARNIACRCSVFPFHGSEDDVWETTIPLGGSVIVRKVYIDTREQRLKTCS